MTPRTLRRSLPAALLGLFLCSGLARAEAAAKPPVGLAIDAFTYRDSSGESADQTAVHRRRLALLMAALRRDFGADTQFHLVTLPCGPRCNGETTTPAELLHEAAAAGAEILVIGGIHKMSTLIQWMKIEAIDVPADRVVADKLFTFRGDTDQSWRRAEEFASGEIRAALAARRLPPAAPSGDHS